MDTEQTPALVRPKERTTAYDARFQAQKLAFAPVVFQIARILRDRGVLILLDKNPGLTLAQLQSKISLPLYSVRLLLEGGVTAGILLRDKEKFYLAKVGYFLLHDELTKVNFNFMNDVCYEGLAHLEESLVAEKPAGLKVFGDWDVIYDGLAILPEKAKQSWFAFDHFYSDAAFKEALPYVFKHDPKHLLDVGGNTGRFVEKCVAFSPDVKVTIVDLPGQINMAKTHLSLNALNRVNFVIGNVLETETVFPEADAIWMSQFLDCFSPSEIKIILGKAYAALKTGGELFILETFCDRQKYEASTFCVVNTSFYFTCMANGNSRMYAANDMIQLVRDSGFAVAEDRDEIGLGHTLLRCAKGSVKP